MAIVTTSTKPVAADLPRWPEVVRTAIRDADGLCDYLRLPPEYRESARHAARQFPVFAPLPFVARMRIGDPHDPLLRQVLPVAAELDEVAGFTADPVGDRAATLAPGMLQKYSSRALLITTGACAVHCRYCFRRQYPYGESPHGLEQWRPALAHLAAAPDIEEVILSGGDPLMIADNQLLALVARLAAIPHLRRLRLHTRLPVMIPQRITAELAAGLRQTRLTTWFVLHANHPQEFDAAVDAALTRLVDAGIPLLNQSVLLKGVNDAVATLVNLSRHLVELRVTPYYLHQLDHVAGAAHFAVSDQAGQEIIEQMRRQLPGYAVPRLVRESAGTPYKTLLA
jgi:EF-P beta-lysylation protein EpmB